MSLDRNELAARFAVALVGRESFNNIGGADWVVSVDAIKYADALLARLAATAPAERPEWLRVTDPKCWPVKEGYVSVGVPYKVDSWRDDGAAFVLATDAHPVALCDGEWSPCAAPESPTPDEAKPTYTPRIGDVVKHAEREIMAVLVRQNSGGRWVAVYIDEDGEKDIYAVGSWWKFSRRATREECAHAGIDFVDESPTPDEEPSEEVVLKATRAYEVAFFDGKSREDSIRATLRAYEAAKREANR